MAVTFQKTKVQPIAPVVPPPVETILVGPEAELSAHKALIDELGEMTADYQAAKKFIKAYEEKAKKLKETLDAKAPADQAFAELGEDYLAEFTPKARQRVVTDMNAVRQHLGHATFMQLVQIRMGDLDKYLTPDEMQTCVATLQDGSRSVQFLKKVS